MSLRARSRSVLPLRASREDPPILNLRTVPPATSCSPRHSRGSRGPLPLHFPTLAVPVLAVSSSRFPAPPPRTHRIPDLQPLIRLALHKLPSDIVLRLPAERTGTSPFRRHLLRRGLGQRGEARAGSSIALQRSGRGGGVPPDEGGAEWDETGSDHHGCANHGVSRCFGWGLT